MRLRLLQRMAGAELRLLLDPYHISAVKLLRQRASVVTIHHA